MPYTIRKQGSEWVIVKESSPGRWKVISHHKSREKAKAAMRVRQGVEHGWKPTGKRGR